MKISYYDLLGLIKKEKEPKEIEVELVSGKPVKYVADYDSVEEGLNALSKEYSNSVAR